VINNAPEFYEKPAVHIFLTPPIPEEMISAILWGLEEEGIPASLQEKESGKAVALAKAAANGSMLNVGIGMNKTEVVLHHRDLPLEGPLFSLGTKELIQTRLRILGANAARLVKGNPLIVPYGLPGPDKCKLPV
jgi:hypothetical protein